MSGITKTLTSGAKVPFLAFGTGTALYQQDVTDHVSQAIDAGFTHIDTAQMYGNEEYVGKALAAYFSKPGVTRESLYVTTKFSALSAGQSVRSLFDDQLRKLQLSYVDLYLVHTPVPFQGKLGEIWKEIEQLKREGLTKEIGISNFRVEDLNELLPTITERENGILPSVHQLEFHPYVLDTVVPIMKIGEKHGIKIASFGGLTPVIRKTDGPVTPVVDAIVKKWKDAGKEGTAGLVMLKWLDTKDAIAVTTTNKTSRMADMLNVINLPDLSPEEVNALDEAGLKIHFRQWMKHMDVKRT